MWIGAWVTGGVVHDELLPVGGDPAGDALPHGDTQVRRGLTEVLPRVRLEGYGVERLAIVAQDVDTGVVEGHHALSLRTERGANLLHAGQARELRGHRLHRLELGRPGDRPRPQAGGHVVHQLPCLHARQRQVLIVEGLAALAFEHQQATPFIGQCQACDSAGRACPPRAVVRNRRSLRPLPAGGSSGRIGGDTDSPSQTEATSSSTPSPRSR